MSDLDNPYCAWTLSYDGQQMTGCGRMFEFFDGGVESNGFKFCPFCGNKIIDPVDEVQS